MLALLAQLYDFIGDMTIGVDKSIMPLTREQHHCLRPRSVYHLHSLDSNMLTIKSSIIHPQTEAA